MKIHFEKIAVIGLGYIGLPTAAMLASRGIKVIGVDIDSDTVEIINAGDVHIVEPDLDIVVKSVVHTGHLRASNLAEPADAFLITVPTPFKENYQPDLSNVETAVLSIAPVLKKGNLIVLESTSPVGTTEAISKQLATLRPDLIFPHASLKKADVNIAYCPERVMPGLIIRELVENDRIIGGITPACTEKAKSLYRLFVRGQCITADSRTAEMAKLTENAFRDVNIAFANELSMICDQLKINVWDLIKLANRHPRVNILQPGPGVGGHCIAVDPWFIVHAAPTQAKLIRAAREVNEQKSQFVLSKIMQLANQLVNPRIACLGLAYKPDTDDLRESPALRIMQQLARNTPYTIRIVEPNIKQLPLLFNDNPRIQLVTLEEAIACSDIIILMVAHKEFKSLAVTNDNKIFINVVNRDNKEPDTMTWGAEKNAVKPVSAYGLMMLNRLYGHMIP